MELISASDMERYAYCGLSWWLSRLGITGASEGLEAGKHKHLEIYHGAKAVKKQEDRVFTSEFMISVLSTSAAILSIIGVGIYLTQQLTETMVTMLLAAFWLVAATFFLFVSLKATQIARQKRRVAQIPDGTIEYIGAPDAKDLVDDDNGLIGKPDYVIKMNGDHIPVEIKTGRTPRGPLFSHILQLGCYCTLVNENLGKPPHGILSYRDKRYNIEYTDELREMVLETAEKMREHIATKDIHRTHSKPGKCRHCSRRDYCPERLL